jgi:hypothetical protein
LSDALPTGTYEKRTLPSGGAERSTSPPNAPSLTSTTSGLGASRKLSCAKPSARPRSARVSLARRCSRLALSSLRSEVMVLSGVRFASISAISMRSESPRPPISFETSERAAVRRSGATSFAFIDALPSTSTTTLRVSRASAERRGSPSAKIKSASRTNCKSKDRIRFSWENSRVDSRSPSTSRQMGENTTATGRRRSFRM